MENALRQFHIQFSAVASESGSCPRGLRQQNAIQWVPGFPGVASCTYEIWRVGCSHRYCESHNGVTGSNFNCGFWFWQLMENNLYSSSWFPQFKVLHQYVFQAFTILWQVASMLVRTFSQSWLRIGSLILTALWIRQSATTRTTQMRALFGLQGAGLG